MSDRASPASAAVVTPGAQPGLSSTLHLPPQTPTARPPMPEAAPVVQGHRAPPPPPASRPPAKPSSVPPPAMANHSVPPPPHKPASVPPRPATAERPASLTMRPSAVQCANCGAPGTPGAHFCRECGTPLDSSTAPTVPQSVQGTPATCWRCNGVRDPNASFCRFCGASFLEAPGPDGAPPSAQLEPASVAQHARLVTLLKDGSEGRSIPLGDVDADIGSAEGEVVFADDPYMSPRHARITQRAGQYVLRDLDSVNGVYVRLREEVELRDRDTILLGQQVVRFEVLGEGELSLGPAWQRGVMVFGTPEATRYARLVQYTTEGVGRDVHYLFRDETVIGRENGDIVFTDDPFLSRRHAAVRVDQAARRFSLHDLGSSNGTALRIRGEHVLRDGDQFRIGRHLFRFEAGLAGGRAGR